MIGSAEVAALIDKNARLVWMCMPRMDGDPVFCRLLKGRRPGRKRRVVDQHRRLRLDGASLSPQHRNSGAHAHRQGRQSAAHPRCATLKQCRSHLSPVAVTRIIEPLSSSPHDVTVNVDPLRTAVSLPRPRAVQAMSGSARRPSSAPDHGCARRLRLAHAFIRQSLLFLRAWRTKRLPSAIGGSATVAREDTRLLDRMGPLSVLARRLAGYGDPSPSR